MMLVGSTDGDVMTPSRMTTDDDSYDDNDGGTRDDETRPIVSLFSWLRPSRKVASVFA